jgi:hypothetical protein
VRPRLDADLSSPSSAEVKRGAIPPLPQAPYMACSRSALFYLRHTIARKFRTR